MDSRATPDPCGAAVHDERIFPGVPAPTLVVLVTTVQEEDSMKTIKITLTAFALVAAAIVTSEA
jgi:hypothetical protein